MQVVTKYQKQPFLGVCIVCLANAGTKKGSKIG